MPLITTNASLSKQGFFSPTVLSLGGGAYIAYTTGSLPEGGWVPASSGNSYITIGSGLVKLDSYGSIVWQFTSTYLTNLSSVTCVNIDSSENIYVGGRGITKYNSSGTFQWTKNLDPVGGGGVDPVTVFGIEFDSSDNPLVFYNNIPFYDDPSAYGIYALYVLAKYTTTGTLTNQRRILTTTASPAYLGIDSTNSCVIASSKSFAISGNPGIYNGIYPWSNTTTNNTILSQTTTTGSDFYAPVITNENPTRQSWIVSDGTYYYQIAYRQVSGVGYYVYMRIDRATGAISYSNNITISGSQIQPYGIAIDNSGGLYIMGGVSGGSSYCYIAKFTASTGSPIWEKTLSVSGGTAVPKTLEWKNGFLYIRTILFGGSTYITFFKLRDSGIADGTYGTYFIVSTVSSTRTAVNSQNTGTLTDSVSTTTFSESTPTGSTTASSYTLTTTAI